MKFLQKIIAQKLVWAPTQVHQKLKQVIVLANEQLGNTVFLQATREFHDDVPIVRVLLGPGDPYTGERIGSFAFYSTSRGMEWYVKQFGPADFTAHQGSVYITYFSDFLKKEVPLTKLNLKDADSIWSQVLVSKVKKEVM